MKWRVCNKVVPAYFKRNPMDGAIGPVRYVGRLYGYTACACCTQVFGHALLGLWTGFRFSVDHAKSNLTMRESWRVSLGDAGAEQTFRSDL